MAIGDSIAKKLRRNLVVVLTAICCAAIAAVEARSEPAQGASAPASQTSPTEKPKRHQVTGIVASLTDTALVVIKGTGKKKTSWLFVRNEKTRTVGILTRNAKVTVYYHAEKGRKIAERVKVVESAIPPAPVAKPPAPKQKP